VLFLTLLSPQVNVVLAFFQYLQILMNFKVCAETDFAQNLVKKPYFLKRTLIQQITNYCLLLIFICCCQCQ